MMPISKRNLRLLDALVRAGEMPSPLVAEVLWGTDVPPVHTKVLISTAIATLNKALDPYGVQIVNRHRFKGRGTRAVYAIPDDQRTAAHAALDGLTEARRRARRAADVRDMPAHDRPAVG